MLKFAQYEKAFKNVKFERDGGIIQVTFHTDDGPLTWGKEPTTHADMTNALVAVSQDPENRVVIVTGAGDVFCGPPASAASFPRGGPERWEIVRSNQTRILHAMMDMPGPVIGCLNGPGYRHSQIPLMANIVLAADHALIQDTAHFPNRTVPGDGVQLLFPLMMGWTRGSYFLLTGQTMTASELHKLGLVNEVLPLKDLLPRAWELARTFANQDPLLLRYTHLALNAGLRDLVQRHLGQGLALEGLAGLSVARSQQ